MGDKNSYFGRQLKRKFLCMEENHQIYNWMTFICQITSSCVVYLMNGLFPTGYSTRLQVPPPRFFAYFKPSWSRTFSYQLQSLILRRKKSRGLINGTSIRKITCDAILRTTRNANKFLQSEVFYNGPCFHRYTMAFC